MIAPIQFFKDAILELKRVAWPPKTIVLRHTIYIIMSVALAAMVVGVIDFLFTELLALWLK